MKIKKLLFGVLFLVMMSPFTAADTITFALSSEHHSISLTLPTNPTPDMVGPYFFTLNDVSFTLDGTPQLARIVNFFEASAGGGLGICDYTNCPLVDLFGAQLFTGPLDSPTLIAGSYLLTDAGDGFIPDDFQTVVAVPEPASLLLLASGGLVVARRKRR